VEERPLFGHHPGTVEWLLDAVERHATTEKDALDQYEHVGTTSGDPVIALMMRLILEDETRQQRRIDGALHSLLLEMMALDSENHARLPQFVHDRLAARSRTDDGPLA
jgi:hypothetical protein